jgi:hypothetical protein
MVLIKTYILFKGSINRIIFITFTFQKKVPSNLLLTRLQLFSVMFYFLFEVNLLLFLFQE